jgi:hypothetical protein
VPPSRIGGGTSYRPPLASAAQRKRVGETVAEQPLNKQHLRQTPHAEAYDRQPETAA